MADLLAELRAVMELAGKVDAADARCALPLGVLEHDQACFAYADARKTYADAAVNFLRAHHAELAEALRDARRYRWLRTQEVAIYTPLSVPADGSLLDATCDAAIGQAKSTNNKETL